MGQPVIIDVETQNTFQEVGYNLKKLKISIVCYFDYATSQYGHFFESEISKLFPILEHASHIIGFNINKFDLPVISPYYVGKIDHFATLDILQEVEKILGHRIALDDLVRATLGVKKSGHGFLAIEYFKNKQFDKLKAYCLDDVKLTKDLYEYGLKKKMLYFKTSKGNKEIPVVFEKKADLNLNVPLSIPF